jgi:hypothetical protein
MKVFLVFFCPKNEVILMQGGQGFCPLHFQCVHVFGTIQVAPQQSLLPSSHEQVKSN